MNERAPPFRYALEPLLRRDAWTRDALAAELQRTTLLAEQALRRWQEAQTRVESAATRMRELHERNRTIAVEERQRLHAFLDQVHAQAGERQAEWRRAQQLQEQVVEQFEQQCRAVRTLERHRERQHHDHRAEHGRQELQRADEHWLLRRPRG